MGLEHYAGQISFDGHPVDKVRKDCLVAWDDLAFYPGLSGLDNLELATGLKRKQIKPIASQYLGRKVLKDKTRHYSAGQRKKLNIVLVELSNPKYLVMDEISNGLDYESLKELQPVIAGWSKRMTILLTGHQFSFYNSLADDIFLYKDQQIKPYALDNDKTDHHKLEDIYDAEIIAKRD
jgi:ABC-2 type transport system ATP-binding protein